MWDVGGHVVRIPRGSPPHGQVCGALGASLAIVDCSIGDAEPTVHGRSDVHPTWPDLLKEQEPGAAALHSKSAGHQSGMAQRVQKKSAHLDWSHVRGGASGGGDQAHGPQEDDLGDSRGFGELGEEGNGEHEGSATNHR